MPTEYSGGLFFSVGKNFNTCLIHKQSTDCLAWKNFPSFSAFYTPLLNSDRWKLAEQGIYGKANTNFNERETSNKICFHTGLAVVEFIKAERKLIWRVYGSMYFVVQSWMIC